MNYTIYKNNVWLEILYKGVPMNSVVIFRGKNKKECEKWLERKLKNENNI